jgi:hypothetical protein
MNACAKRCGVAPDYPSGRCSTNCPRSRRRRSTSVPGYVALHRRRKNSSAMWRHSSAVVMPYSCCPLGGRLSKGICNGLLRLFERLLSCSPLVAGSRCGLPETAAYACPVARLAMWKWAPCPVLITPLPPDRFALAPKRAAVPKGLQPAPHRRLKTKQTGGHSGLIGINSPSQTMCSCQWL